LWWRLRYLRRAVWAADQSIGYRSRATVSFFGGLAYGLRRRPSRFLDR
jgi:hypothetical protein